MPRSAKAPRTGRAAARTSRLPRIRLGVIGGSGLYEMSGLEAVRRVSLATPFGDPSDGIVTGSIGGVAVGFLPRHGRGHRILPSDINYRANLWALKRLGAEFVLSLSAVGSLRQRIRPGDIVVPDQFLDRTRERRSTFFGEGVVAHVMFADPVCPRLSKVLADAARADGARVHRRGTYLCMEGPQFSTRAESHLYRKWGAHVIGMTNLQEAKLAREAEICFATLALVTDYDCWKGDGADVEIGAILRILSENAARARRIVKAIAERLPERTCACGSALEHAIVTERGKIPAPTRRALAPIVDRALGAGP